MLNELNGAVSFICYGAKPDLKPFSWSDWDLPSRIRWKQGQAVEGIKKGSEGVEMCSCEELMQ